jgi:hypothetical protein
MRDRVNSPTSSFSQALRLPVPVRSSAMKDTIRVVIHGEEQHIPREMVGFHAAFELGIRLGMNPSGFSLRRKSDETYLGASVPVGDVLRDGDELEFAPHSVFSAAA